jgi:hypothetical protein
MRHSIPLGSGIVRWIAFAMARHDSAAAQDGAPHNVRGSRDTLGRAENSWRQQDRPGATERRSAGGSTPGRGKSADRRDDAR